MSKNEPTKEPVKWTKSVDTRYISGEDLHYYLGGLEPSMDVYLWKTSMGDTYDKNTNQNQSKVVLYFRRYPDGTEIPKGVIGGKLNRSVFLALAEQFYRKCGVKQTEYDDVIVASNIPVVMYAAQDKRYGYVVRFKPYDIPADLNRTCTKLTSVKSVKELEEVFLGLSESDRRNPYVIKFTKTLKDKFNE